MKLQYRLTVLLASINYLQAEELTLCSVSATNPVVNKGIIINDICYQTTKREGRSVTIYNDGGQLISDKLKNYLTGFTYYSRPERYISLGLGWYYDTTKKQLNYMVPPNDSHTTYLYLLHTNYHMFQEDDSIEFPKHFIYKGVFKKKTECCRHWMTSL